MSVSLSDVCGCSSLLQLLKQGGVADIVGLVDNADVNIQRLACRAVHVLAQDKALATKITALGYAPPELTLSPHMSVLR